MTEAEFRNKITWMTFFFSVLVVMIHGNNIDLFVSAGEAGSLSAAARSLEGFISDAMPTVAVPGFFMVSAYLFCRNLTWKKVPEKMLRRVGSVLVPYIVWNSLYYFAMAAAGAVPGLRELAGKETVAFSVENWADAILNFTYNPVLWYMQQLIILIALAPLIYALMSRLYIGAASLLLLLFVISKGVLIPILNLDALLYYSVGAWLALHARGVVERSDKDKRGKAAERRETTEHKETSGVMRRVLRGSSIFLSILLCAALYIGSRRYYSVLATVLYGICSPMAVWNALPSGHLPEAKNWMKYNFFLYAYHFLLVRGINKVGAVLLPPGAGTALAIYLCLPVLAVLINWMTAEGLKRYLPGLWRLLNGGR